MENLTVHRTRDFSERSQFCEKSFIYFMNPFEKRDAGAGIFYALIFCMFFGCCEIGSEYSNRN